MSEEKLQGPLKNPEWTDAEDREWEINADQGIPTWKPNQQGSSRNSKTVSNTDSLASERVEHSEKYDALTGEEAKEAAAAAKRVLEDLEAKKSK